MVGRFRAQSSLDLHQTESTRDIQISRSAVSCSKQAWIRGSNPRERNQVQRVLRVSCQYVMRGLLQQPCRPTDPRFFGGMCWSVAILAFGVLWSLPASASPLGRVMRSCQGVADVRDDCIKDNLNQIIPTLAHGWEWIGVPEIDPLILPTTITSGYHRDNMTLDVTLKNTVIKGLARFAVVVVKSKGISQGKVEIITKTPSITCLGEYTSEGIAATFPLHSSGRFNVTMSDVNTAWIVYLKTNQRRDGRYLKMEDLRLDVMPVEITIKAAKALDGSNELGEIMDLYLNENSFELYNVIKPNVMKYFQDLFSLIAEQIFNSSPLDEYFPKIEVDW